MFVRNRQHTPNNVLMLLCVWHRWKISTRCPSRVCYVYAAVEIFCRRRIRLRKQSLYRLLELCR